VRADRFKQILKNSVYRTIGETASAIGANGNGERSLRVLMYHKVNDLPSNPLTMPVSIFDEQMDQLRDLDYTVVDLDAVLGHYVDGKPLPERAVLITFDDGYYDNLDNAARVLRKYGCSFRSAISTTAIPCRTRSISPRRASSTGRSSGRSLRIWSEKEFASSPTASRIARSPISRSTKRRARSPCRSCGWKSGSGGPCAPSPM
jgi:hypothetical protein